MSKYQFDVAPPATRTLPSANRLAVCRVRQTFMFPVRVQVPVAGSYSSAHPAPATRTVPSVSRVAARFESGAHASLPVRVQVPAAGSYNSPDSDPQVLGKPPAT